MGQSTEMFFLSFGELHGIRFAEKRARSVARPQRGSAA
jgi:hypothetical protein